MSHFYRASFITPDGKHESKDFFLPSLAMVRREIVASGATVIAIAEKQHTAWQKEWYSLDYKINFLKSIAMQTRAGKSAGQALATVISNERNPRKRVELDATLQMIEKQGRDFSDAVAQLGIFDRTVITILRAGEHAGMKTAVEAAVKYLTEQKAGLKQLIGGLGWVGVEFVFAFISTFQVQYQVLPWLEEQISKGKRAPDSVQFAHDIALAYFANGLFLAASVALIAFAGLIIVLYNKDARVRSSIDQWLLGTPVLNRFLIDGVMAQSFHVASIMLSSRVTFYDTAQILANVCHVPIVRRYWQGVSRALRSTSSTSEALAAGGMLHREEQQLLRHHEDSYQLSESFELLAENRTDSFKRGRAMFIRMGFGAMMLYSLISIGVVMYIYMLYSDTLTANLMDSIGGEF